MTATTAAGARGVTSRASRRIGLGILMPAVTVETARGGAGGQVNPASPWEGTATVGKILVGTASWTDKTLLASGWYPKSASTPEQRLAYYAGKFHLVEVDSTYYAPPAQRTVELWRDRTPAEFTFNIKAFSLLTQHPRGRGRSTRTCASSWATRRRISTCATSPPAVVDRGLEAFPRRALAAARGRQAWRDLVPVSAVVRDRPGKEGVSAGMQGAVRSDAGLRRVPQLHLDERAEPRRDPGLPAQICLPYVSVDMPQGHPSSIPPVVAATAPLAVVRFHGHSAKWTSKDIHERFGYKYSAAELREWAPKLRAAGQRDGSHPCPDE